MHVILLQFRVANPQKKEELEQLLKSPEGLAYTQSQKGFISVEFGWTKDANGNETWWGWEKWETKEDFENYVAKRREDVEWANKFFSITDSQKPLWIENLEKR